MGDIAWILAQLKDKIKTFRPYIDSCAVGGLQSKRTQTKHTKVKMYLSGVKIYSSEVKT